MRCLSLIFLSPRRIRIIPEEPDRHRLSFSIQLSFPGMAFRYPFFEVTPSIQGIYQGDREWSLLGKRCPIFDWGGWGCIYPQRR
jgi:hypothetical protein